MEKGSLHWEIFRFEDIDSGLLYEILALRSRVFVVEQHCPYLDPNHKDQKAWHLCGFYDGRPVAYCRIFRAGNYFQQASLGRVVVDPAFRKFGFGKRLMRHALEFLDHTLREKEVVISAQLYLKSFYQQSGFRPVSDPYPEDDIPHIRIKREI
ncbi:MAG: GNAT family N-acetyltransferase [Rikenellaceae bacterium]|nr:GNAT family N-acetyltransferase [Rikenellaceae bacterium]